MNITLMQEFELWHCGECGIGFAVPVVFSKKRHEDGQNWHCPNGHVRHFTGTTVQRLECEKADLQRVIEGERLQRLKAEKIMRRLQKRIASGVCPCCNRTFQNLQRHMGTKHKGYALPPAKEQKQISGAVQ